MKALITVLVTLLAFAFVAFTLSLAVGCAGPPAPPQPIQQAQKPEVAPEPRAENVRGDVNQPTITQMEEAVKESNVETKGDVAGGVSTVRYGLDEGTSGMLTSLGKGFLDYASKSGDAAGRVVCACVVFAMGMYLVALFAPAPANGGLQFAFLLGGGLIALTGVGMLAAPFFFK